MAKKKTHILRGEQEGFDEHTRILRGDKKNDDILHLFVEKRWRSRNNAFCDENKTVLTKTHVFCDAARNVMRYYPFSMRKDGDEENTHFAGRTRRL